MHTLLEFTCLWLSMVHRRSMVSTHDAHTQRQRIKCFAAFYPVAQPHRVCGSRARYSLVPHPIIPLSCNAALDIVIPRTSMPMVAFLTSARMFAAVQRRSLARHSQTICASTTKKRQRANNCHRTCTHHAIRDALLGPRLTVPHSPRELRWPGFARTHK